MELTREKARSLVGSPYAWLVLGLLTLIYITSFVDRQIIAVLAVQIQNELALSNFTVGLLYGPAFSIVYAISGIPMGRLADLYSRKRIILAGLAVWSVMTFVSGFATGLVMLVSARFFVGIAESALSPAVYSLLSDYFRPEQRATVFSIYASGIFIGIGVAFLAGGGVAQAYDWRTSLMAVGLPGLLLAGVGAFAILELPRGLVGDSRRFNLKQPLAEVLAYLMGKKTLWWHFLGFSFSALTGYTILAFVGTILTEIHDAARLIPHYGWFMLATALSVMVAGKAADRLARRFDPSRRFLVGIAAGLLCLPLYYFGLFAGSGHQALILIGLANVISSSYNGVAAALIQYLVKPNMRALAGGLYLFVISVIGFGVGPPLAGWLMDRVFTGAYGPAQTLFLVITGSGVMGSICFLFAMRSYHRDAEVE